MTGNKKVKMSNAGIVVDINKRETFLTETRPQVDWQSKITRTVVHYGSLCSRYDT